MTSATAIAEEFKQYAYSVSHDVSAPVRAMVEFSKLLLAEEMEKLSPDGREYLSFVIENGAKLQSMMDGLLEYSRLNTTHVPLAETDMTPLVQSIIMEFDNVNTLAGGVIEMSPLPRIRVDAEQMKRLFRALIDNALKFQPTGNSPLITISAQRTATNIAFMVTDNGIGIAPSHHESIFRPFKRLHTDEEYAGIGMGLTLARKIAQHHGGTLLCSPHASRGSTFTLTLPVQEV